MLLVDLWKYIDTRGRPRAHRDPQGDPPHHAHPRGRPVADDIDTVAGILLCDAGFDQKNGAAVVHIDK